MEWIASHAADLVVASLIAVALLFAVRETFFRGGLSCDGCSGDCSGCGGSCSATKGLTLSAKQKEQLRALRESRMSAHKSA